MAIRTISSPPATATSRCVSARFFAIAARARQALSLSCGDSQCSSIAAHISSAAPTAAAASRPFESVARSARARQPAVCRYTRPTSHSIAAHTSATAPPSTASCCAAWPAPHSAASASHAARWTCADCWWSAMAWHSTLTRPRSVRVAASSGLAASAHTALQPASTRAWWCGWRRIAAAMRRGAGLPVVFSSSSDTSSSRTSRTPSRARPLTCQHAWVSTSGEAAK
mmetsp:Transcript_67253/g.162531  ORF Transcript_67253/g.162531 Transcript_67253/m.162531 type:complete len:226 (-) Transcript_67253:147-824(-)